MTAQQLLIGPHYLRACARLPGETLIAANEALQRLMLDPRYPGLHNEKLHDAGSADARIEVRSIRVDLDHRIIHAADGDRIVALHAGNHDGAYRWKDRHLGAIPSHVARATPLRVANAPPRFAPDSTDAGDSGAAVAVSDAEIPYCPVHPQVYLRHESTAPSFVRVMQASGDRVFLCRGDSGGCSWRYSVQVGEYSLAAGPQPESIGADFGLYMAERQRLGLNTHRRRQPQERRGYARR